MLGLIARGDDRGLGILTYEAAVHLRPDRLLVLDVPESPFPFHRDRFRAFPNVLYATWHPGRPQLPPELVSRFLDGLDTVYTAETFYDPTLAQRALDAGVRPVIHAMPEFAVDWPEGVEVWLPTPWLKERFPAGTPIVPVPVPFRHEPAARFPAPLGPDEPLVVLHTAGNRAAADRNGTEVIGRLIRKFSPARPVTFRISVQRGVRPAVGTLPPNVRVEFRDAVADRWSLYDGAHVLALPRRYGGLCLPVQEAAASGLAIALPDISPNDWYPADLFEAPSTAGRLKTPGGMIPVAEPNEDALAALIERYLGGYLTSARWDAIQWAETHSWGALAPLYERMLR